MKRVSIFVSGIVQGVFFRHYTNEKARQLGLKGWVRNLADKRVEILVEGEQSSVNVLVEWCNTGSPSAKVEEVIVEEHPYQGNLGDFYIAR